MPQLFEYTESTIEGPALRVVDLAQVAAVNYSHAYGNYYLVIAGVSYRIGKEYGDALLAAWVAFRGKFKPQEQR